MEKLINAGLLALPLIFASLQAMADYGVWMVTCPDQAPILQGELEARQIFGFKPSSSSPVALSTFSDKRSQHLEARVNDLLSKLQPKENLNDALQEASVPSKFLLKPAPNCTRKLLALQQFHPPQSKELFVESDLWSSLSEDMKRSALLEVATAEWLNAQTKVTHTHLDFARLLAVYFRSEEKTTPAKPFLSQIKNFFLSEFDLDGAEFHLLARSSSVPGLDLRTTDRKVEAFENSNTGFLFHEKETLWRPRSPASIPSVETLKEVKKSFFTYFAIYDSSTLTYTKDPLPQATRPNEILSYSERPSTNVELTWQKLDHSHPLTSFSCTAERSLFPVCPGHSGPGGCYLAQNEKPCVVQINKQTLRLAVSGLGADFKRFGESEQTFSFDLSKNLQVSLPKINHHLFKRLAFHAHRSTLDTETLEKFVHQSVYRQNDSWYAGFIALDSEGLVDTQLSELSVSEDFESALKADHPKLNFEIPENSNTNRILLITINEPLDPYYGQRFLYVPHGHSGIIQIHTAKGTREVQLNTTKLFPVKGQKIEIKGVTHE